MIFCVFTQGFLHCYKTCCLRYLVFVVAYNFAVGENWGPDSLHREVLGHTSDAKLFKNTVACVNAHAS